MGKNEHEYCSKRLFRSLKSVRQEDNGQIYRAEVNCSEAIPQGTCMEDSGKVTEAINRCEVTIHLLQKGYMIFHPEADVDGIDFVLRNPQGVELHPKLTHLAG